MINYRCDGCGHFVAVKDEFAGRPIRCPSCGTAGTIPLPKAAAPAPVPAPATAPAASDPAVIKFICECGKKIGVPAVHAGKTVRCPKCGQSLRVPSPEHTEPADEVSFTERLADLAAMEAGAEAPDIRSSSQPKTRGSASQARSPIARSSPARKDSLDEGDSLDNDYSPTTDRQTDTLDDDSSGDYGLAPSALYQPPPAVPTIAVSQTVAGARGSFGQFTADCFKSIGYAARMFPSLMGMVMLLMLVLLGVGIVVAITCWGDPDKIQRFAQTTGGSIVMFVLEVSGDLVVGGLFLQFFMEMGDATVHGIESSPHRPMLSFGSLMLTGLKGMGLQVVYVLPIITLPLLPIGLLGMSYTQDARAFNVLWALKVAAKRPGQLAIVWLVLIICVGVILLLTIVVYTIFGAIVVGMVVAKVGGILMLLAVVFVGVAAGTAMMLSLSTIAFRCAGLLGFHYPETARDLDRRGMGAAVGSLLVCLAVSVVVYFAVLTSMMNRLGRSDEGGTGPFSPGRSMSSGSVSAVAKTKYNLNAIAKGVVLYRADHSDATPPDLAALTRAGLVSPRSFISPVSKNPGAEVNGQFVGQSDYIYIPAPTTLKQCILAYERPENYDDRGTYVILNNDNWDCFWVSYSQFQSMLAATQRDIAVANRRPVRPK